MPVGLGEDRVGRLDGQAATVRHGFSGVDAQVDQDLLHLRRVDADRTQVGIRPELQFDVFADEAQEHLALVRQCLVKVQDLYPQHLAP